MNFIINILHFLLLAIKFEKLFPSVDTLAISKQIVRFVISGILINLCVLVVYEILIFFFPYNHVVILVFIIGFVVTFLLNNFYVCAQKRVGLLALTKYSFAYVFNCFVSYAILVFIVEIMGVKSCWGIFYVIFYAAPANFIASKLILDRDRNDKKIEI